MVTAPHRIEEFRHATGLVRYGPRQILLKALGISEDVRHALLRRFHCWIILIPQRVLDANRLLQTGGAFDSGDLKCTIERQFEAYIDLSIGIFGGVQALECKAPIHGCVLADHFHLDTRQYQRPLGLLRLLKMILLAGQVAVSCDARAARKSIEDSRGLR